MIAQRCENTAASPAQLGILEPMAAEGPRSPLLAATLSLLVPGAGHLYAGARRRGLILLGVTAALCLAVVATLATDPLEITLGLLGRPLLAAVLAANVVFLALRVFAVVDAWRVSASVPQGVAAAALAAVVAVTAAPHVAVGYAAVRGYSTLDAVFADEEPGDILPSRGPFLKETRREPRAEPGRRPRPEPVTLPNGEPLADSRRILLEEEESFEHPWVTMLLIGSDHGPGNVGDRTDTIVVAALQRATGRAVLLGVPRNLVEVPLGGVAGEKLPRFREPLNALYSFARTRPELFPGGSDPGATALKQTVSRLLGLRIDYYALVDLDGFRDIVDALGGVTIRVKERLVDSVTRPAWGESKPRIDVYPGRTYHFSGRIALAYVRSRKDSSDYQRMARQRCFLSAMANQLDVFTVLRNFGRLTATVEDSVRTDIPLDRVPDVVRLVAAVEPRETLTETFGLEYFARRRKSDRYPIANLGKIRTTVRDAILLPQLAERRSIESASKSC
jgi:LCP family protein required for cell wall assembly